MLSVKELKMVYDAVLALKDNLHLDEGAGPLGAEITDDINQLETLLTGMLDDEKALDVSEDILTNDLNIRHCGGGGGVLAAKDDKLLVQASSALQPEPGDIWSSKNLQRHLTALVQAAQRESCVVDVASARIWIHAFLFRASAMVGEGRHMILDPEWHTIAQGDSTAMAALARRIDYVVFVTEEALAESMLKGKTRMTAVYEMIKNAAAAQETQDRRLLPSGFFVVEAKSTDEKPGLMDHMPQAVAKLYACATLLRQKFVRGALTNGHTWVFIIVRRNEDGGPRGGKYKRSESMSLEITVDKGNKSREVNKYSADRIAGVLSYWVDHSFEDVGVDDWFECFSWED